MLEEVAEGGEGLRGDGFGLEVEFAEFEEEGLG